MFELIFHHCASLPFSEKIRLTFGLKQMKWRSVVVPVVMPKPDLVAGGYGRTPVLQIGANLYGVTTHIADVRASGAVAKPVSTGAGRRCPHAGAVGRRHAFLGCDCGCISASRYAGTARAFIIGSGPGVDHGPRALRGNAPRMAVAEATVPLRMSLNRVEPMLASGGGFLLDDQPCIADVSVSHACWYVRRAAAAWAILEATPRVVDWRDRMAAIGGHVCDAMSSNAALAIAVVTGRVDRAGGEGRVDHFGARLGGRVVITPSDYGGDPVAGTLLVVSTAERLALERTDERAGRVTVHIPPIGFQMNDSENATSKV